VPNSVQAKKVSMRQIFCAVLPDLMIETVVDQSHPTQLRLHTWHGDKAATTPTAVHCGCTYTPAPIPNGLPRAIRFPGSSKAFGTATQLFASMSKLLDRYANLPPGTTEIIVAFSLASWFVDCFPVAPLLHLLGPDNEITRVLRLMDCLCRRPILLSDFDVAALSTLPSNLDPTLLVNQRNLGRCLTRVLLASNDRHFRVARGKGEIHAYGAKAFASVPEFASGTGVRISLPPIQELLPTLTNAEETDIAADLQAKLLRYRLVNYRRVSQVELDTSDFVPAMREEIRAWLAPICDCAGLQKVVSNFLLQQSREAEGDRMSDDRCVVAETALFFCHRPNTGHFFVGELAKMVNTLLTGRHDDRALTDKKVGLLLRALGIHGERVVQGYKVSLTDAVRERIHRVATSYRVVSMKDGVARCAQCSVEGFCGKVN
jgi:hypothetical protein